MYRLTHFITYVHTVARNILYYYYYNSCLTAFSWTTGVSWYQKGKTSLDLHEARDDEVLGCSGIS